MSLKDDIEEAVRQRKIAKMETEYEEKNRHKNQLMPQFHAWIEELNSHILYLTSLGINQTTCVNTFVVNMTKEQEEMAIGIFQNIADIFKAENVTCKLDTMMLKKESWIPMHSNVFRFCYYCKVSLSWENK